MNTMDHRIPLTVCGDTMDATEILEILGMVNEMENITKVEISLGRSPSLYIEKATAGGEPPSTTKVEVKPTQATPAAIPPGFGSAKAYEPSPPTNLATEGQRKYADDLAKKLGEGDMMNVVYGLAHALGVPADDILHPKQWLDSLTREQADSYLDVLEDQYKKMKRSAFQ